MLTTAVMIFVYWLFGALLMLIALDLIEPEGPSWTDEKVVAYCIAWPYFIIKHALLVLFWCIRAVIKYR